MSEQIFRRADWNDLALFLAVAECGGLSAAARRTGASAPTLGRTMRALERSLGRDLFIRRTHGYDLTEQGRQLLEDLGPIAARLDRLTAPADRQLLPVVKMTGGTWTMLDITTMLPTLIGTPPDVRLRLVTSEAELSLTRREASIGFRNHRPTDVSLAGRLLRRVTFAPYATANAPERWIVVVADTPSARWVGSAVGDVACETTIPRMALDLALGGIGRAVLPTFIGDAQSSLHRVGPQIDELGHEQWLVTHQDDRALPEIRRVLDRINSAMEERNGHPSQPREALA